MTPLTITKEMLLAAECSWLPGSVDGCRIQEARVDSLMPGIEPETLLDLFGRHRISNLAQRVLETHGLLPSLGRSADRLVRSNGRHASRQLAMASAEHAVRHTMESSGIPFQILKGVTLSHRLYGDPFLRHSKDVDLLVPPERLWEAVALLERNGWVEEHPCLPRTAPYRFLLRRRWYHFEFKNSTTGTHLEVHWHVEEIPGTKLDDLWLPRLLSSRPGDPIGAFEFLYLCAHGEHHAWMRLKWLGDIRALLDRHPQLWEDAWVAAEELGMRPAMRQVEALLALLYDFCPAKPSPDADTPLLLEAAIRSLCAESPANGVPWGGGVSARIKSVRYSWIGYRRFGWLDRIHGLLLREGFNARDMMLLRLPGALLWLLPLARVLLLLARPFSKTLRRARLEAYGH